MNQDGQINIFDLVLCKKYLHNTGRPECGCQSDTGFSARQNYGIP
ncbi:MAG: hypothetical protein IJ642_11195 [Oscillospiraceae bacterium]|nr:hypothetical protein [Oscillospiraceae bacterium]